MGKDSYQELKNAALRFRQWVEASGFLLLLDAWKNNKDVIMSVLLASFVINVLGLVFPLTLLQVYDRIIPHQSYGTLIWLTIIVAVALLLAAVLKVIRAYVGAWADAKFEHKLGCDAFSSLLNCKLSLYEREGSGRHLKRLTSLNSLKQFYAGQALISVIDVPFIFVYLGLIAYIGGLLVIIPIIIIISAFITTLNNTDALLKKLKERQDHDERRLNFIVETLSKIHTIKSTTMEAQMLRRYERLQKSSSFFDFKITQGSSALVSDSIVFSQSTVALIAAWGSVQVFNGSLTVGILAACILLAGQCLQPVNSLLSMWGRLQSIKLAHEELNKILTMVPENEGDFKELKEVQGKIRFENVSLKASNDDYFILKDIDLTIDANETISITGEGLSGKSTLISLLLKLQDPTQGRILIDDNDIAEIDPHSLRAAIGFMPEQAILFKGTILDNMTMFQEEYETRARNLARETGLARFIEQFPDGYDTKVGGQAAEVLPRGLIQHIVIIRALVRDPKIILFDEADTTIDMEGDKNIIGLLKLLKNNRTMILVSHRPSVTAIAHRQFVMEKGHLRLLAKKDSGSLTNE